MNIIKNFSFYSEIKSMNGKIYLVGGYVRDNIMNISCNDLDLVISNITINNCKDCLERYGKIDIVGESFGVIKFKDSISNKTIDIALPRTDKKNLIQTDINLSIEHDLERRDFTINSMAIDDNDNLIDPFNGIDDIKNKIIRCTNKEAFMDDPLRMLRAIRFATKYNFEIEEFTYNQIYISANNIKYISSPRILNEFEKIVNTKNICYGVELLVKTGIYKALFQYEEPKTKLDIFKNCNKLSEFIYLLLRGNTGCPENILKNNLKGKVSDTKEILALNTCENILTEHKIELFESNNSKIDKKIQQKVIHEIYKIAPNIINSKLIIHIYENILQDFYSKKYPFSLKELNINGNDLLLLGYKNIDISKILNKCLYLIYDDILINDKDEIIKYLKTNK